MSLPAPIIPCPSLAWVCSALSEVPEQVTVPQEIRCWIKLTFLIFLLGFGVPCRDSGEVTGGLCTGPSALVFGLSQTC